jgi:hypothetical protein
MRNASFLSITEISTCVPSLTTSHAARSGTMLLDGPVANVLADISGQYTKCTDYRLQMDLTIGANDA